MLLSLLPNPPGRKSERERQVDRMIDLSALTFLSLIVSIMVESFLLAGLAPRTFLQDAAVYAAAASIPVCEALLVVVLMRNIIDAHHRSKP